jgi:hypothetical protein
MPISAMLVDDGDVDLDDLFGLDNPDERMSARRCECFCIANCYQRNVKAAIEILANSTLSTTACHAFHRSLACIDVLLTHCAPSFHSAGPE